MKRTPTLTPAIRAVILQWHARKRELGGQKQLAHRLGVSQKSVQYVIYTRSRP